MTASRGSCYAGSEVALLTQHGKERVIAPVLEPALGCHVRLASGFDTDRLGTFTRDIPRLGSQLEAARKKARIGMELSGLPLGIASEGSFGPDPFVGFFAWNRELIVFIDNDRGLEIVGMAQSRASFDHLLSDDWATIENFGRELDFPRQHLVVRPENENDPRARKGVASWTALESVFKRARAESVSGRVFVETDGRAHANPLRRETIRRATEDLAAKIASLCPVCGTRGFWQVENIVGLPCESCGLPTNEIRAQVYGCLRCSHRTIQPIKDRSYAKAGCCNYCNP